MAANINWHRYGTNLRHCRPLYTVIDPVFVCVCQDKKPQARDDGVLGCSGYASWTIRKQSAPRSRQITTATPHQSIFTDRMLFLTPN